MQFRTSARLVLPVLASCLALAVWTMGSDGSDRDMLLSTDRIMSVADDAVFPAAMLLEPLDVAQAGEEHFVEELVAEAAVEALDEAVLHGLAWSDAMPVDACALTLVARGKTVIDRGETEPCRPGKPVGLGGRDRSRKIANPH